MADLARLRLEIRGAVQGVGFRPFVWRLAHDLALAGRVRNDARGVFVEVEGRRGALEDFRRRIESERPAASLVESLSEEWLDPAGLAGFEIEASDGAQAKTAIVLPDLAPCPDCRAELADPADRRYLYPFVNCTNCGPRFSIVTALPYDRPNTTMAGFRMCPRCRAEYGNPADRRFHAQPNACPDCGPSLALVAPDGRRLAERGAALAGAIGALAEGGVVAMKGVGGYLLLCDARDERAVALLRERKRRPVKPFALLVRDLDAARRIAEVSAAEAELLASRQAPIVLLARRAESGLAPSIAPGNPTVGVMLPSSPLHVLVAEAAGFPLVATSGNRADEPIATDDGEARERLAGFADLFLAHDRPIARHVDDSVAAVVDGAPRLLRRARGYAPLPVLLDAPVPCVLAVGAHQKCAVALSVGRQVFLSQHLGDMETPEARDAFERVILDFLALYEARPVAIAHDLHPDYPTTLWAEAAAAAMGGLFERAGIGPAGLPRVAVQHHHAHLAAALAEKGHSGPALALAWDGTGFGPDGTIWGGEALAGDALAFRRIARLRPFRLPGGEAAVREPRRLAAALLWELEGERALERPLAALAGFAAGDRAALRRMLATGLRAPWTSSVGRLFDGVAALAGLPGQVSFEGEAAMALEHAADPDERGSYPFELARAAEPAGLAPGQAPAGELLEIDWRPLVAALLADLARDAGAARVAARFHNTLVEIAAALAAAAGLATVALTGGCFQNRRLAEGAAARLRAAGFDPWLPGAAPVNDGGIALGQIAVAAARLAGREEG